MLLSFDVSAGDMVHGIITKKILPIVGKNTAKFLKD